MKVKVVLEIERVVEVPDGVEVGDYLTEMFEPDESIISFDYEKLGN